MALPTSGFTTNAIRYDVATDGVPFQITVSIRPSEVGTATLAEDIAAVVEPALIALAGDLESVTGVTAGHVYKTFTGDINAGDIA